MSEEIISKRKVARTARMVEMVKNGDAVKIDIGEYSGDHSHTSIQNILYK
jgi:hypothetical protein